MAKVQFRDRQSQWSRKETIQTQGIKAGLLTRKTRQSGTGGKEHMVQIHKGGEDNWTQVKREGD